jgi:hypothetical protein
VSSLIKPSSKTHNTYVTHEYEVSLKYAADVSFHVQDAVVYYWAQIGQFNVYSLYT